MNIKKLKIIIIGLCVVGLTNTKVPTTYRGFVENPYTEETIELAKKVGYLERCTEAIEKSISNMITFAKNRLKKWSNAKIATRINELENATKNIPLGPNLETIGELINPNDALQSKINYLDQKWSDQSEIHSELTELAYYKIGPDNVDQTYKVIQKPTEQLNQSTEQIKSSSFLTRFSDLISQHKVLSAVGGLIAVVGVGYTIYNRYQSKKQKQKDKKDMTFDDFVNTSENNIIS